VTLSQKYATGALYKVNDAFTVTVQMLAFMSNHHQRMPWTVAFSAVVWAPYTMTTSWRAFQARAAATGNARSPSVIRRVDCTSSADVELERRRRRDSTLEVSWRVSARYDGAVPWRQRKPERTNETGRAPAPLANEGRGAVVLCVQTSWLRTPVTPRHWVLIAADAEVILKLRPELSCSNPTYWLPVHESVKLHVTVNAAQYVSGRALQNKFWQLLWRVQSLRRQRPSTLRGRKRQ